MTFDIRTVSLIGNIGLQVQLPNAHDFGRVGFLTAIGFLIKRLQQRLQTDVQVVNGQGFK
jgi:hypothetical protein